MNGFFKRSFAMLMALMMLFAFGASAESARFDVKLDSPFAAFDGAITMGLDDVHGCVQILLESSAFDEIFMQFNEESLVIGNEEAGLKELMADDVSIALSIALQAFQDGIPLEKSIALYRYYSSPEYQADLETMINFISEEANILAYLAMNAGLVSISEYGDMKISATLPEISALLKTYLPMLLEDKAKMQTIRSTGAYKLESAQIEDMLAELALKAKSAESVFAGSGVESFSLEADIDAYGFMDFTMALVKAEPYRDLKISLHNDVYNTGFSVENKNDAGNWKLEFAGNNDSDAVIAFSRNGADGSVFEIGLKSSESASELAANMKNADVSGSLRCSSSMLESACNFDFVKGSRRVYGNYKLVNFPYSENFRILEEENGVTVAEITAASESEDKLSVKAAWDKENKYRLDASARITDDAVLTVSGTVEKGEGAIRYVRPFTFNFNASTGEARLNYTSAGENYADKLDAEYAIDAGVMTGKVSFMKDYTGEGIYDDEYAYYEPAKTEIEGSFRCAAGAESLEASLTSKTVYHRDNFADDESCITVEKTGGKLAVCVSVDDTEIKMECEEETAGNEFRGTGRITASDALPADEEVVIIRYDYAMQTDTGAYTLVMEMPMNGIKAVETFDGTNISLIYTDYEGNVLMEFAGAITNDENGISAKMTGKNAAEYSISEEFGAVRTGEDTYLAYFYADIADMLLRVDVPVTYRTDEDSMHLDISLIVETLEGVMNYGTLAIDGAISYEPAEHVTGTRMSVEEISAMIYNFIEAYADRP